jgi:hypothetical protein
MMIILGRRCATAAIKKSNVTVKRKNRMRA